MERCPNCGAPVRVGARFCTSCGYRLTPTDSDAAPPAPAVAGAGTGSADRPETTWSGQMEASGDGMDAEPASRSPWAPPESGVAEGDPSQSEGAWPAPDAPPAPVWTVPAQRSEEPQPEDPFADWEEEVAEEDQPAEPDEGEPAASQDAPVATESEAGIAESPLAADGDAVAAEEPAMWERTPEPSAAEVETVLWSSDRPATDAGAAMTASAGPLGAGEPAPEPVTAEEVVDEADVPPAPDIPAAMVASEPAGTPAAEGDPLARAASLVEELRAVIQEARSGGGSAADAWRVADELAAARAAEAVMEPSFATLREALASARGRPRDIDTMLDIVGRLDAIVALQEAHDRYAASIDRAVAALRAEVGNAARDV